MLAKNWGGWKGKGVLGNEKAEEQTAEQTADFLRHHGYLHLISIITEIRIIEILGAWKMGCGRVVWGGGAAAAGQGGFDRWWRRGRWEEEVNFPGRRRR